MSEVNLNETFEETMDDATVITVPIDDTLSNSGEAADAAAVGAALALKADLDQVVNISVNGESPDAQGVILLDASEIPMTDEPGAESVSDKLAAVESAVLYDEQTLTEEEQEQARTNIGAASLDELNALKIAPYETHLFEAVGTTYDSNNILKFDEQVINSSNYTNGVFLLFLHGSYANGRGSMYMLMLGSNNADRAQWLVSTSDSSGAHPIISYTANGSPYVCWSSSSGNIYADIFRLR